MRPSMPCVGALGRGRRVLPGLRLPRHPPDGWRLRSRHLVFTVDVRVQPGQTVVESGPYR